MLPTLQPMSTDAPERPGVPPHLPRLVQTPDGAAPAAPANARDSGVDEAALLDLVLKAAYTVPNLTTEWAARRLHLPLTLTAELLDQLRGDRLLENLGQTGPFGYRYAATQRGRERADRLLEVSGYVGPAPVSLEAYTAMLEWQLAHAPPVGAEHVAAAIGELVIPEQARLLAGLAFSSGRSLFVSGPPGNGKTSLSRQLHGALRGDLWIPHCVAVESSVIRIFDPQCHQPADPPAERVGGIDQRWVKVRRPLLIGGGEMTIESFDLSYSPSLRFYEAPLHVKANGGTFLIDDFGRQRVDPHELLNRWIIPLEHQIDYLSLHTGQKIQVPFRLMLIIATNLDAAEVTDPAFLRRMGYRLYLDKPTPEDYARIFERYAALCGTAVEPELLARLFDRYRAEGRELRCCEPRDLIERARDLCRFRGHPLELSAEVLDLAWAGYFGTSPPNRLFPSTVNPG